MDGILIIDKPAGITSHDAVSRIRRVLKTKRVGHTGTLDPFATGVMVVLVGKATRLAQFLDKDEKEYSASMQFGFETDTGDLTGTEKPNAGSGRIPDLSDIQSVLRGSVGEMKQTPPMYSAKKVAGKKMYELARKGLEVDRAAAAISISEIELTDHTELETAGRITIRVACSAGTYIRTLAEDIARAAGARAHLYALRRTRAGRFDLGMSITPEELASADTPGSFLLPVDVAVEHLSAFELTAERVERTRNGMSTRELSGRFAPDEKVRMVSPEGELIAIGSFDHREKAIQPKVVLG